MLLVKEFIEGEGTLALGWVCHECLRALAVNSMPKLALTNDLWIRKVPHKLAILTFPKQLLISCLFPQCYVFKLYPKDSYMNLDHLQQGMMGNVLLYNMNMDAVALMLEGQLLPQPVVSLASMITMTYVGMKKLPKSWLKSTF
jgi:hypothetical protein